ncbi:MAG: fructosamine kinase family protein, partial [Spirochaetota bacterium]|nr:fructosamine kinase family protein [Spirochaetota bacterium]
LGFSSEKQSNVTPFILMEYLQSAPKKSNFFEEFGRNFAKLHKITKSQYGFFEDNFIGKTPQINQWMDEWVDFFRDKRLGYQVELAKKSNLWNEKLNKLWEKLESRLDELIGNPKEPASLLHGDLWSGNYLVGPTGEPILIDPAVYYGSREADLAMTELFGGFDRTFYDSYKEEYPIEPEYDDRAQIYKLYHLLNHLNLFGKQYESSVLSIMEHFSG